MDGWSGEGKRWLSEMWRGEERRGEEGISGNGSGNGNQWIWTQGWGYIYEESIGWENLCECLCCMPDSICFIGDMICTWVL